MVSYSPAVKTERNIHEGSTLQDVINAYGRRCAVQNFDGATLYEYPYDTPQDSLAVMRFAVKNGVVDYISLRIVTDAKEKSDILAAMKTLWREAIVMAKFCRCFRLKKIGGNWKGVDSSW